MTRRPGALSSHCKSGAHAPTNVALLLHTLIAICVAKCWSEWQDLNLRPPRPERGALPDHAMLRLSHPTPAPAATPRNGCPVANTPAARVPTRILVSTGIGVQPHDLKWAEQVVFYVFGGHASIQA
jgi:hypothetical protein